MPVVSPGLEKDFLPETSLSLDKTSKKYYSLTYYKNGGDFAFGGLKPQCGGYTDREIFSDKELLLCAKAVF
jgi:hypothetical protein